MLHKSLIEVGDIGVVGGNIIVFTHLTSWGDLFCYVYDRGDGRPIMRGFSSFKSVYVIGVARGYG